MKGNCGVWRAFEERQCEGKTKIFCWTKRIFIWTSSSYTKTQIYVTTNNYYPFVVYETISFQIVGCEFCVVRWQVHGMDGNAGPGAWKCNSFRYFTHSLNRTVIGVNEHPRRTWFGAFLNEAFEVWAAKKLSLASYIITPFSSWTNRNNNELAIIK